MTFFWFLVLCPFKYKVNTNVTNIRVCSTLFLVLEVNCKAPHPLPLTTVNSTSTLYKDVATYTCQAGYALNDSDWRSNIFSSDCQFDSEWSIDPNREIPTCPCPWSIIPVCIRKYRLSRFISSHRRVHADFVFSCG